MMINNVAGSVLLSISLLLPQAALAITLVAQPDPFAMGEWSSITEQQTQYGELVGWPHTFEFIATSTTELTLQVATAPGATPVSVLVVRQEERGVSEVTRQTGNNTTYTESKDAQYGITLAQAPVLVSTIEGGLYRVEISNAENIGKYQLTVGAEVQPVGYWQTVKDTFAVHAFYGEWWGALLTWRVASIWLLILIFGIWWHNRNKRHG